LRSGREHCGSRVAVGRGGRGGRRGGGGGEEDEEERRRGGEEEEDEAGARRRQEEATDIKSNNPHLAGGEKLWKITIFTGQVNYKWSFSIAMLNYQRV